MVIKPAQLVDEPLALNLAIPPGQIDYAPDVRQTGPLTVNGKAELLVEHRGHKETVDDIRIRAEVEGGFEVLCARCLTGVDLHEQEARRGVERQDHLGAVGLPFRADPGLRHPETVEGAAMVGPGVVDAAAAPRPAVTAPLARHALHRRHIVDLAVYSRMCHGSWDLP